MERPGIAFLQAMPQCLRLTCKTNDGAEQSSQGKPTSIGLRNSHDESVRPA